MNETYVMPGSSEVAMTIHPRTAAAKQEDLLVRRAQNGSLEAFNELVLLHQDRVFRQALWILNDDTAAEDATQETFLKAYRKQNTFRGGFFLPWLLRITTNYCLDQLRESRHRPTQPLEGFDEYDEEYEPTWFRDQNDLPEQAIERSELAEEIIESVKRLAWEFRLPIILVDLQDLDYQEASAVMHISLGTLKSRLSRARQKLCKDFQKKNISGKMRYCMT